MSQALLPLPSSADGATTLSPRLGLWLGAAAIVALGTSPLLPVLQDHTAARCTLWTVALLGAVALIALWRGHRRGRALTVVPHLKPSHYLQILAQGLVYVVWASHWRPVVDHLPLLAVQIVFAYLLELLVGWWRHRCFRLGLGPIPILGSINFFLWFTPAWFSLQLALLVVVWLFREAARWEREGGRVHVFNPSAIGLTLMCLLLVALGHEGYAVGEAIAVSQDETPYIYLAIFGAGLIVQAAFPVVLMTMGAALGALGSDWLYQQLFDLPLFGTTAIPGAVFLGMLLLITDPVTAPRTSAGKLIYGGLYGIAAAALFVALTALGQPTYYDKILAVPLLNLMVRALDRWVRGLGWARAWASPQLRNWAHMAAWAGIFVLARPSLVEHRGALPEFWIEACDRGTPRACEAMAQIHLSRCEHGDLAMCHNLAVMYDVGDRLPRDQAQALRLYQIICEAGDAVGCGNVATMRWAGEGAEQDRGAAVALWRQACGAPGGGESCENLEQVSKGLGLSLDHGQTCAGGSGLGCFRHAVGREREIERDEVARLMGQACDLGFAPGCANLGQMRLRGDGVERDVEQGRGLFARACELGMAKACDEAKRLSEIPSMEMLKRNVEKARAGKYPGGADPAALMGE